MPSRTNYLSKRSRVATKSGVVHPRNVQVAALCWRRNGNGKIRILLISSRDTGRWVIPKGWPMRRRTHAEAAEREAFEEAGVQGELVHESIGLYSYVKHLDKRRSIDCVVQVYPLHVTSRLKEYPESRQRRSKWLSRRKAAQSVREPELKRLIRDFDPEGNGDDS